MNNNLKRYLEKILSSKKIRSIMFLSGKNSFFKTGANNFFKKIFNDKAKYYYFKKSYLPEYRELKEIVFFKDKVKPDIIIAIGGGCVLDYAKIASNFNSLNLSKKKIKSSDIDITERKKVKVLAIPTTAGSGAEVTSNAVMYINQIKYSVEGNSIKPDYYYLEPRFLKSTSLITDSAAGFDAISQAVESLFSLKSNSSSIKYALKSLDILLENYTEFTKNKNLKNSANMAMGANLAGKAINISKTTLPHALSYPFTAIYDIPHGHAVSLTFNKFLKYNFLNINKNNANFSLEKRFDKLFKITKTNNIFELDYFFQSLKKKSFLEQNFLKLGINLDKDIDKILKGINNQRLRNNPIKVNKKDLKKIINYL